MLFRKKEEPRPRVYGDVAHGAPFAEFLLASVFGYIVRHMPRPRPESMSIPPPERIKLVDVSTAMRILEQPRMSFEEEYKHLYSGQVFVDRTVALARLEEMRKQVEAWIPSADYEDFKVHLLQELRWRVEGCATFSKPTFEEFKASREEQRASLEQEAERDKVGLEKLNVWLVGVHELAKQVNGG